MKNFSRIAMFRKRLGYTQQELADKLGVTKAAVCRYEKEEATLKLPLLKQIAKALEVPMVKLVGLDNEFANHMYLDAMKNNPEEIYNESYFLDEELILYFKTLAVSMGLKEYLDMEDQELLSIIKGDELKLMFELILYKMKNR